VTHRAGCQKATKELSLRNSQSLSHLRYPTDTRQLTSLQGEADGVSHGGMMLQALGGVNLPCGWYHVKGQLPSNGGREHTHTHTHTPYHNYYSRVFTVTLVLSRFLVGGVQYSTCIPLPLA
jgi:hypothetical protein